MLYGEKERNSYILELLVVMLGEFFVIALFTPVFPVNHLVYVATGVVLKTVAAN